MPIDRRLVTIAGILTLILANSSWCPSADAKAFEGNGPDTKAVEAKEVNGGLQTSEETYGSNKYQVARVVVNATPAQVQDVLTNYSRTAKMFNNVKQCHVVEDHGADKKIAFVASTACNFFTFQYVLDVHESPGYIEWHRASGAFKRNEGFWKLEPLDGGHSTRVTYAKFVDSGIIPQALVVRELRDSMPTILTNLKSNSESKMHVADTEYGIK